MLVKIKSVQEAFKKEGLDANKVTVTGIPERHIDAVIAVAKLFVVNDHVQPEFNPDFENDNQWKYELWFRMGSSSGFGFSYYYFGGWDTYSTVGSRLVYQDRDTMRYVTDHPEFLELYKTLMVYKREVKKAK
jgi:hypothetical protein